MNRRDGIGWARTYFIWGTLFGVLGSGSISAAARGDYLVAALCVGAAYAAYHQAVTAKRPLLAEDK